MLTRQCQRLRMSCTGFSAMLWQEQLLGSSSSQVLAVQEPPAYRRSFARLPRRRRAPLASEELQKPAVADDPAKPPLNNDDLRASLPEHLRHLVRLSDDPELPRWDSENTIPHQARRRIGCVQLPKGLDVEIERLIKGACKIHDADLHRKIGCGVAV